MTEKEWKELCEWVKTVSDEVRILNFGEIQINIRNLTYTIFQKGVLAIVYDKEPTYLELLLANNRSDKQIKAIIKNLIS